MTEFSEAGDFFRKAETALVSAGLLLKAGDHEGACKPGLLRDVRRGPSGASGVGSPYRRGGDKTHRGLIAAFGQKLIQEGTVDPALGRAFNRMHDIRVRADYTAGSPTSQDAEWAVSRAETFVAALREPFFAP